MYIEKDVRNVRESVLLKLSTGIEPTDLDYEILGACSDWLCYHNLVDTDADKQTFGEFTRRFAKAEIELKAALDEACREIYKGRY